MRVIDVEVMGSPLEDDSLDILRRRKEHYEQDASRKSEVINSVCFPSAVNMYTGSSSLAFQKQSIQSSS